MEVTITEKALLYYRSCAEIQLGQTRSYGAHNAKCVLKKSQRRYSQQLRRLYTLDRTSHKQQLQVCKWHPPSVVTRSQFSSRRCLVTRSSSVYLGILRKD